MNPNRIKWLLRYIRTAIQIARCFTRCPCTPTVSLWKVALTRRKTARAIITDCPHNLPENRMEIGPFVDNYTVYPYFYSERIRQRYSFPIFCRKRLGFAESWNESKSNENKHRFFRAIIMVYSDVGLVVKPSNGNAKIPSRIFRQDTKPSTAQMKPSPYV